MRYGSFQNQYLYGSAKSPEQVYEGMPATAVYWTDRRAAQVTKVINQKTIEVQFCEVKCLDYYAGEYEIGDPCGHGMIYTLRKNGRWIKRGSSMTSGQQVTLGVASHYVDPHF